MNDPVAPGDPTAGPAAPVRVFVSAGSNIDPEANLRLACRELRRRFGPLAVSSVYRSPAVGFAGADFLNLVLSFATRESPAGVVAELERLHQLAGRVRGPSSFASRTLDLDMILYGDGVIADHATRVPRDDIEKYAFVLAPLAELAPAVRHPVTGRTFADMWRDFDQAGQRLERTALTLD